MLSRKAPKRIHQNLAVIYTTMGCIKNVLQYYFQTDLFKPVQPDVPVRADSFAVYSSAHDSSSSIPSISEPTNKKDLLSTTSSCSSSASQLSPRLGGPGSAFKPYASSENLFDPVATKHMQELPPLAPTHNYPLRNGDINDSRYLLKMQNGSSREGPIHGKVKELRKPIKAPFSTTDTEPEMRECNLSHLDSRKKGKKQVVYSTSETEEEYQAYLRSKPKWHGKGGHKDSWDPLLIQSPPQITQKPVGVIPKPQAALAVVPVAPVIERGLQVAPAPIYAPVTVVQSHVPDVVPEIPVQNKQPLLPQQQLKQQSQFDQSEQKTSDKQQQNQQQQNQWQQQQQKQQYQQQQFMQQQQQLQQQQEQQQQHQLQPLQQQEQQQYQQREELKMQTLQFPLTERVQKSNSIVEVRRIEQSLPVTVAEINRKSLIENQAMIDTNQHGPAEPQAQSLSSIMKQSLTQPKPSNSLNQSIKPPQFMSQNSTDKEILDTMMSSSNKFPQSPMMQRSSIRTPTSKLVSELEVKKERSPFIHHQVVANETGSLYGRLQPKNDKPDAFLHPETSESGQSDTGSGSKFTPQRELQQKLMNEALQKIGDKKEAPKKQFTKTTRY